MSTPKPDPSQVQRFANIELSLCRVYLLTDAIETRQHRGFYVCDEIPSRHAERIANEVVLVLAYIAMEGAP